MTNEQWKKLLAVMDGRGLRARCRSGSSSTARGCPAGRAFPRWTITPVTRSGSTANLKAVRTFPQIMFLPGFWSEFGMCTEPSAFGTKCRWAEHDLPFADASSRRSTMSAAWKSPMPGPMDCCLL